MKVAQLIGLIACLVVPAGCSSPTAGLAQGLSASVQGWLAHSSTDVEFLSWTQVGTGVSGTFRAAGISSGSASPIVGGASFDGVVSGQSVTLSLSGSGIHMTVSGQLVGLTLTLSVQNTSSGLIENEVFRPGTPSEYNQAVKELGSSVPSSTQDDAQGNVFDDAKVATGVTKVLTDPPPDGYGQTNVSGVSCPADEPVRTDSIFSCTGNIDGVSKTITVTVLNDNGKYSVGVPQ